MWNGSAVKVFLTSDDPRADAPICPAFSRSAGLPALMTFAIGLT